MAISTNPFDPTPDTTTTGTADPSAPMIQLYNLEGQPMEQIPAGTPIPEGRWNSPQGGYLTRNAGWGLAPGTYGGGTMTTPTGFAGDTAHRTYTAANNTLGGVSGPNVVTNPTTLSQFVSGKLGPTGISNPLNPTDSMTYNPSGVNSDATAHYRDIFGEAGATLAAQQALAPLTYQNYAQYTPQYAKTDIETLARSLFGDSYNGDDALGGLTLTAINQELTRRANEQTADANASLRLSNLSDVDTLGGGYLQSYMNLNPSLYGHLDKVDAAAGARFNPLTGQATQTGYQGALGQQFGEGNTAYDRVTSAPITAQQINAPTIGQPGNVNAPGSDLGLNTAAQRLGTTGPGPIQQTLEQQATRDLALGRGLSGEDTRMAQQAAREAWADRGLIDSKGAVAEEVLNRDQISRQRERERQGFAAAVDQTGFAQRQQGLQSALGYSSAAQGYGALGLQAGLANQQMGFNTGSANQQAQLQALLANQGRGLEAQQTGAGLNLQSQLANQAARQAALGQNQQLGLNLAQMETGQNQQGYQNLLAAANARQATAFDPFGTILGQATQNFGQNQSLLGGGGAASSGAFGNQNVAQQFNPMNPYASDLYNTNFNAVEGARINANNVSAGKSAGWLNFAGTVLGSLLGGKR